MRALALAPLSLFALSLACGGDEPGGLDASVALASVTLNPGAPDSLANLDVTLELQARGQPEEVTIGDVMMTQQPVTDSSNTASFMAELVNPQGDDPVVRFAKGESINIRVLNVGTTNADLDGWCGASAELFVSVDTADGDTASATANVTVRCP